MSPINKSVTPNQVAAGGPIPPNYTLAQQEVKCAIAENNPPWFKTLNAFENYNPNRVHYWKLSAVRIGRYGETMDDIVSKCVRAYEQVHGAPTKE